MMAAAEAVDATVPEAVQAPDHDGPVAKKARCDDTETDTDKALVDEAGMNAEEVDAIPDLDGKDVEVLWTVGPDQVWWLATAKAKSKRDRKNRINYTLDYVARRDLGYGAEKRTVIFTGPGLLRDRKTIMQYRLAGDTRVPEPLLAYKQCVAVQSEDDTEEWLSGIIEGVNDDGSYEIRVATTKRNTVPREKIIPAFEPTRLPRYKTAKHFDRLFQKLCKYFRELDENVEIASKQTRTFSAALRGIKSTVVPILENAIGDVDNVKELSQMIDDVEIAELYNSKLREVFTNAIKKLLQEQTPKDSCASTQDQSEEVHPTDNNKIIADKTENLSDASCQKTVDPVNNHM